MLLQSILSRQLFLASFLFPLCQLKHKHYYISNIERTMHALPLIILLVILLCLCADCFQSYQSLIPNSLKVKRNGELWPAVGHDTKAYSKSGLNPFGNDFASNANVWTTALCNGDSDGDGQSNGLELGDPLCVWKPSSGDPPARETDISHPGYADSVTSATMPPSATSTTGEETTTSAQSTDDVMSTTSGQNSSTGAETTAPGTTATATTTQETSTSSPPNKTGTPPPVPNYKHTIRVLKEMNFSWEVENLGTAEVPTSCLVGSFRWTSQWGWVSTGLKSDTMMNGFMVICAIDYTADFAQCTDYWGDKWTYTPMSTSRTVTLTWDLSGPIHEVSFRRVIIDRGVDLNISETKGSTRTIWAYGPSSPFGSLGIHPSDGVSVIVLDILNGTKEAVEIIDRRRHVMIFAALTVGASALIFFVRYTMGIRVHHYARRALGIIYTLIFSMLATWYVLAARRSYISRGLDEPLGRAMGDGAAFCLCCTLFLVNRRFFDLLFHVSHELAIKYHLFVASCTMFCLTWHAVAMLKSFELSYILQWIESETEHVIMLPAVVAGALFILVYFPALQRLTCSYAFFRLSHYAWIPGVIFSCLHYSDLTYIVTPISTLIIFTFIYDMIANQSAQLESFYYDTDTNVLVLTIVRRYYRWISFFSFDSGLREKIGADPGQWSYLRIRDVSFVQYHPFSIARSEVDVRPEGGALHRLKFLIKATFGKPPNGPGLIRRATEVLSPKFKDKLDKFAEEHSWTTKVGREMHQVQLTPKAERASLHVDAHVGMLGPYGSLPLPPQQYSHLLLVSGGIGITPNIFTMQCAAASSLAWQTSSRWRNIELVWVIRDANLLNLLSEDLVEYKKELQLANINTRVRIFITQQPSGGGADRGSGETALSMSQSGSEMLMRSLKANEENASGNNSPPTTPQLRVFTEKKEVATNSELEVVVGCRPNFKVICQKFAEVAVAATPMDRLAALYVCGPTRMMDDALTSAANVTVEDFSFHSQTRGFDI